MVFRSLTQNSRKPQLCTNLLRELNSVAMSVYTDAQVSEWLDVIGLPAKFRPRAQPKRDAEMLKVVFIYQIAAIAYENLNLHYSSPERAVDLDPQVLFRKMVSDRRGRGG